MRIKTVGHYVAFWWEQGITIFKHCLIIWLSNYHMLPCRKSEISMRLQLSQAEWEGYFNLPLLIGVQPTEEWGAERICWNGVQKRAVKQPGHYLWCHNKNSLKSWSSRPVIHGYCPEPGWSFKLWRNPGTPYRCTPTLVNQTSIIRRYLEWTCAWSRPK